MRSTFILLINFLVLGQSLLANKLSDDPVPEKMQAIKSFAVSSPSTNGKKSFTYASRQGGIFFTSDNKSIKDTDVSPTITLVREGAPYKFYKISLLNNDPIGVHFMVLPVGNYVIDSFYEGFDPLGLASQNLLSAKFSVKPDIIEYLGRIKITVSPDANFSFEVNDFYSQDLSSFRKLKGDVPVTKCILNFGRGGACSKIKEDDNEGS